MKKKKIICFTLVLIFLITLFILLFMHKIEKKFYLENRYYDSSDIDEIEIEELNQLIDKKESFSVFVYQPMCIISANFESVLLDFLDNNQISIYKIAFSNIKDTDIGKSIKYYPSFIIYYKGEMVDFLEANKDEDVEFYTSEDGFKKWFTQYVKLKNNSSNSTNFSDDEKVTEDNTVLKDVNLEYIIKEDNKVNIYFFWGDGCPHCEEEFEFFESIQEQYEDRYNLYTFETWHNEENKQLLRIFAESMGDKVKGVPYTIIGEKSFTGFNERYKTEFISAIESQYNNNKDVYFDKIKR